LIAFEGDIVSHVYPNEPEIKAEYDDLDAATLYNWAMETLSSEERESLLQAAALKGSDEAKYALYLMESAKPGVDPGTHAFAYLVDYADNGNWLAQFQVAQVYAGKAVMIGIMPNPRKALYYYEKARESSWYAFQNNPTDLARYYYCAACVSLADIYLSGTGTVIREDKAFLLTKQVSYLGSRCAGLAQFYLNGIGTDVNTDEAYIWALIEKAKYLTNTPNDEIILLLDKITPPVKAEDRIALQREAARRHEILMSRPLTDEDLIAVIQASNIDSNVPNISNKQADALAELSNWKIDSITDLNIIMFTKDRNVQFIYGNRKVVLPLKQAFSNNSIRLLILYDKHINHQEASIGCYSPTISDGIKSKRTNEGIVSDFNYDLRKLLNLDKNLKPFEWFGVTKMDKTLKANFSIKVVY
jgi:hypothetical protein